MTIDDLCNELRDGFMAPYPPLSQDDLDELWVRVVINDGTATHDETARLFAALVAAEERCKELHEAGLGILGWLPLSHMEDVTWPENRAALERFRAALTATDGEREERL